MTREEKCKLAIAKGYTYNPDTGNIYGIRGNVITSKHPKGYIRFCLYINNKPYYLSGHQFAWYFVKKEIVKCLDHINGIKDDNRICNLRSVTEQENHFNRTKVKGYSFNKNTNKWQSSIMLDGKIIYLGSFVLEEEAREAYLQAKQKYHIITKPSN